MPVSCTPDDVDDARPKVQPELIDVAHFAELLGVSTRHVRRLVDAGKCPPPVRLGRACRWSRRVVEAWIADGCPSCRVRRQGVDR
ncbi:MAG: DNA-binding protein [Planctomycetia bacterium]|nr:DNA-binding protein [Planctomycetia bacterium]